MLPTDGKRTSSLYQRQPVAPLVLQEHVMSIDTSGNTASIVSMDAHRVGAHSHRSARHELAVAVDTSMRINKHACSPSPSMTHLHKRENKSEAPGDDNNGARDIRFRRNRWDTFATEVPSGNFGDRCMLCAYLVRALTLIGKSQAVCRTNEATLGVDPECEFRNCPPKSIRREFSDRA